MATRRSYQDACPIARGLDLVGERWALLVLRELLLGPQRYSDLLAALPGVSTNLLSDRLRELRTQEIVQRRRLSPPAASTVYELTDRGKAVAPVLEALGTFGAAAPPRGDQRHISATSALLYLRSCLASAEDRPEGVFRIELAERVWALELGACSVCIEQGEPGAADAGLRTDPATLSALVDDADALERAVASGAAETHGDRSLLRRLFRHAAGHSATFAVAAHPD